METGVLFIVAIAAIVNLAVIYLIIQTATKANLREKHDRAQVDLLMLIAKQQGVLQAEINHVITEAYK